MNKIVEIAKEMTEGITKGFEESQKAVRSIMKHEAEKEAQPFIQTNILEDIRNKLEKRDWWKIVGTIASVIVLILLIYQIFF